MQPAICSVLGKSMRLVVALILLFLPVCVLFTPQTGLTGIEIVGFCCPYCGNLVEYLPGRKIPATCPHCHRSLVQQEKPTVQAKPQLQPINPFGDFLFKDVPIIPVDGKLQTRHLDTDNTAVKAEEWSKEMKQMDTQSRQKQEAQAREFEHNKQDVLKSLDASRSNSPALRQLKNIYADPKAWDGDSSVVDLRGKTSLTPQILGTGAPGSPGSGTSSEHAEIQRIIDQGKYAHMSPEELDAIAAQYPDNAEIQQTVASLKAKTMSMNKFGAWSDQAREKEETMNSENQQGNREALRATATVLDLTAKIPAGLDEVYYGEKTPAQWLGIDLASDRLDTRFQDFAVGKADKFALNNGWKTPAPVNFLGGAQGLVDGVTAVPKLKELYDTADKAGDHYVAAGELKAELQASGGTGSAVDKWSDMRNDALNTSARLARLIQDEKEKNKQTVVP